MAGHSLYRNRRVLAWALYDWANSAFATTVMAGFFPLFYKTFCNYGTDAQLSTFRLGITSSAASLCVAVCAPLLGAFADERCTRKRFLAAFTLLGACATAALFFIPQGSWFIPALIYGSALVGFNCALVFYDSFLPDVSRDESRHKVSSLGYSLGYLGGGILFGINVLMYLFPGSFGLSGPVQAVKVSFVTAGMWWLMFSLPLFFFVSEKPRETMPLSFCAAVSGSLRQLRATLALILGMQELKFFLLAYWFYIDGVNTVMKMAVDYGAALGFGADALITALLLTQFIGFPSTLVFAKLSEGVGPRRGIAAGIGIYALTTIWASRMSSAWEFYVLASVIGLVQGGVQALSRSLYSQMVPPSQSAQFFSFFDIVGKFATVVGPALVGVVALYSGSSRGGVLSLLLLFLVGAFFLVRSGDGKGSMTIAA
ncbi:MAG TPA: MFS transporter [Oligoflexia bacterium]|nr:MFS transporter [Oligoflexia bacterium]